MNSSFQKYPYYVHTMCSLKNFREKRIFMEKNPVSTRFSNLTSLSKESYCVFQKFGTNSKNDDFCKNRKKVIKLANLQVPITFFVLKLQKNHKYDLDSKFDELSENDHHLSDSLN